MADADCFRFEGNLTLASVSRWRERARAALLAGTRAFDFSAVTTADSSALSLIFDLLRTGEPRALRFIALPPSLLALADLYGVSSLLPTAGGGVSEPLSVVDGVSPPEGGL